MRSVEGRLSKLEQGAAAMKYATPETPCICPDGERHIYFTVAGMTDAEVAAILPHNRKHCPKCGGLNLHMETDADDLRC